MNKLYQRINWQNYPSDSTPLNESNLNKMDAAVDGIDDRVVTLDVTKLPVATANTMVKDVTFNESTGVFTITKLNGTKVTVNTALEKIATNFRLDHSTQKLILTLIDGTTQEVDLSALLTQYEFLNSSTIQFTIDSSGKVKASVVNGSITGDMLEPNYLANVTLQASKADTSAKNAKESEEKASEYAENAKNSADSAEPVASTATGTNQTIQDSTNAPFIYGKFKGYTKQQMYSGKNLCDNNNFTLTAGTDTVESNYVYQEINIADKLKSDTTYILSADVKIIAGTPIGISIALFDEGLVSGSEIVREGIITNNHVEVAIESGSNASDFYYLLIYAGIQGITAGNSIEFSNVMFRESTTDATYEPYVGGIASPNPGYPQEINGLAKDGSVEVRTCGKNLINDSAMIGKTGVIDTYHDVKFKPNKTYYFVAKTTSGDGMARGYFGVYLLDKDGKFVVSYINQTGKYVSEFTLTEEQANSIVKCRITANGTQPSDMLVTEVAISETPEYEPYTETIATIPTDAPHYEGDYIEVYADGSGKEYRKMKEIVLDGSNLKLTGLDGFSTTGLNYAYLTVSDRASNDKQSNSVSSIGIVPNASYEGIAFGLNNSVVVVLKDEKTGVVSTDTKEQAVKKFNTWLQSNPVTVVYELAEPTETPLTAQQVEQFKKLYTFEPVTNVLCDGEVEIRYYKANVNGETVGMLQEQTKDFAKKTIYGDTTINVGRKEGSFVGDCSTAEGYDTTASASYAHSEGNHTTASGLASHSEGYNTTASGYYAHAEGSGTTASGDSSHSEGYNTTASGYASHSEGNSTIASSQSQHVQGKYNVEDTEDKYAHIVGGGTFKKRKNIHTLDWDGNAEFAGNVLGHVNGNSVSLSNITRYLGRIDLGMHATQNTYDFTSFAGYDRYTLVFKGTDANRSLFTRELLTIHNIEKNTSSVGKACLNISNNYTFEPWVEMYPSGNKTYIVVGITDTTGLTTLVSSLFVEVYGAMD